MAKSFTRTYKSWNGMIQRCHGDKGSKHPRYGGRGIYVCERWRIFENFLEDMRECPEDHTIDRIDNDGNYTPENCRWATKKQQANNTKDTIWIELGRETHTLSQWSEMTGIPSLTFLARLRRGLSLDDIINKPRPRRHKVTSSESITWLGTLKRRKQEILQHT